MRYKYCGKSVILDTSTDGWAHECEAHADRLNEQDDEIKKLKEKLKVQSESIEKITKDVKEAVNTTWRFIGAYKKENAVPVNQALKSAEYHLCEIDYIFKELEGER